MQTQTQNVPDHISADLVRRQAHPHVGSDWWNWGILVTVLTVFFTLFGSTLYIRKNHYEFFLIMHVLLALTQHGYT